MGLNTRLSSLVKELTVFKTDGVAKCCNIEGRSGSASRFVA